MTQQADDYPWRWKTGNVKRHEEHMELLYGDINKQGSKDLVPVALVSSPVDHIFVVEFLLNETIENNREIIEDVTRDLDFYLIEKHEKEPWTYAQYHCSTVSNLYSKVHWTYYPHGR
jgi:hypothetical protein